MSTKRELITDLRAHRAGLVEKREEIDAELQGIEAALEALNGTTPPRSRAASGQRQEEVLRILGENPETPFTPAEMAAAGDMPHASALQAIRKLIDQDKVKLDGETLRGQPIVKAKPEPVYEDVTP